MRTQVSLDVVPRVLIVNGSLAGDTGNTAWLLRCSLAYWPNRCVPEWLHLAAETNPARWREALSQADILLFGVGTYWDQWSSVLQRFFEELTDTEGSSLWLGKPTGVVVTMHSVGGKGILSRLQGVLNTFGVLLPPMSGLVYSAAGHLALQDTNPEHESITMDLWRPEDLAVICHNLVEAYRGGSDWKVWETDRGDGRLRWTRSGDSE